MDTNFENPYPGPVTFTEEQDKLFFGREIAIRKLVSFIRSQSVVVLYGKSGTGKSSLLKAGIIPALKAASKPSAVLLPIRYQGIDLATDDFVISTIQQLNRITKQVFSSTSLVDWFTQFQHSLADEFLQHEVLIFDQFEEIFTIASEAWEARERLFDELEELLIQYSNVRALLIIREDFLGDLFRYASRLTGGIDIRYQLLMLKPDEARLAIERPMDYATDGHTRFASTATTRVIEALRAEQNYDDGSTDTGLYQTEFVSPLLLQLVCHDLWSQLPSDLEIITEAGLDGRLDVDATVIEFYRTVVRDVAHEHKLRESDLYRWFEEELVAGERRTPIFVRDNLVGTLDQPIALALDQKHLIRRELSATGLEYYELSHDRFVSAVLQVRSERMTPAETEIPFAESVTIEKSLETSGEAESYRVPQEQISARQIWSQLSALIGRGRLTAVEAIAFTGRVLNSLSRSLDNLQSYSADALLDDSLDQFLPNRLAQNEREGVRQAISRSITEYSRASIQDIFYWLLNEAAASRPQTFNDIFTPFTIGQLMMTLLSPSHDGHLYDPACHSGELFGYYRREAVAHFSNETAYRVLAADRFVESQLVATTLLEIADYDFVVTIRDALRNPSDEIQQFDYAFTNPPFNDRNVDWSAIPDRLKPFGSSSNSNMAWVQHIYASLKPTGRAAFLMVSNLAKSNDPTLRQLLNLGAIEAIIDLGQDRFYRGVAVHLWLLNRNLEGREAPVLFIDMTDLGIQRRPRLFTEAHIDRAFHSVETFRDLVEQGQYDDSSLLDEPGFCKSVQLMELTQLETLDLAPRTHVVSLPRSEPEQDIRVLIQEYEALRAKAAQLDARVSETLTNIQGRLQ